MISTMKKNAQVDQHLRTVARWQKELEQLRAVLLESPLEEEWKWGKPCYTFQKSNVVILYALKDSCALGFLKGALVKDPRHVLVAPGENSQSARWIKFTDGREIARMKPVLKAYIQEAIAAEKAGLKIDFNENKELVFSQEFQDKMEANPALKKAFAALTPGRQRGYNLFFSAAKQAETRASRVEKCRERILSGKGLHDCICGRTQKPPACDGSHASR